MDKRALLAIILCLLIWIAWEKIFLRKPTQQPVKEDSTEGVTIEGSKVEKGAEEVEKGGLTWEIHEQKEVKKRMRYDNTEYGIDIDDRGDIINIELKKYKKKQERKTILGILWESIKSGRFRRDLLKRPEPENIRPVLDYNLFYQSLNMNGERVDIDKLDCDLVDNKLTCFYEERDTLRMISEQEFSSSNYYSDLTIRYKNIGEESIVIDADYQFTKKIKRKSKKSRYDAPAKVIFKEPKGIKKLNINKVGDGITETGDFEWFAFSEKYFLLALVPDKLIRSLYLNKKDENIFILFKKRIELNKDEEEITRFRIFFGPKRMETLKDARKGLEASIDFGFFEIIARPILYLLKFFHSLIHSYGISIILLTLFIKIILFPLTHKSYKSMKALQKIQPQIAELKEKYKNDRERLNKEMLELFKLHNVNPMSGCLPMLLQMPIWFALYQVLLNAIELYNTPFLYLDDLSSRDFYCISPIILGITMFIQQRMTPSTVTDPAQARMMRLMPLFFTVIMFSLPSGLVLYILVNTLLSILQQWIINRMK